MLSVHRKQLAKVAKGNFPKLSRVSALKSAPSSYMPIAMVGVALSAEHHRQGQLALSQAYTKASQEDEERRRRLAMEETMRLLALDAARAKQGVIERITKKTIKTIKTLLRGFNIIRRILELAILGAPVLVLFPLSQHLANKKKAAGVEAGQQPKKRGNDGVLARMGVKADSGGGKKLKENEVLSEQDLDEIQKQDSSDVAYVDKLLWKYLRWSIARAGPTSIKMAQWAATRDDLFPEELCDKLAELQQEAPPHAWSDTEATFREAFGPDWSKHLSISEEDRNKPLGSGCVAQVYRGVVDIEGKKQAVALKVLHPNIVEKVNEDLRLLKGAALFLERIFPQLAILGPRRVVEDFGMRLTQQLDLTQEANHLNRFNKNFEDVPEISFPKPITHDNLKSTQKVLIETFINATPILEFIERKEVTEQTKKKLSKTCLKAIMKMVLLDNMLHGDLHPGNILISEEKGLAPKKKAGAFQRMFGDDATDGLTVVFLDAGLSIDLDEYAHNTMVNVLRAFTERDGRAAAKFAVEASERAVALEAINGNEENESVFDSVIESFSKVLLWMNLSGKEVEYKYEKESAEKASEDKTSVDNKSLAAEATTKQDKHLSAEENEKRKQEMKDRARLINLEAFYDGCNEVMLAAQASDRLSLELGMHMRNMFGLACDYSVRLEPYFVSVAIAVRVMEGISSRLDPDIKIAPVAAQIFAQMPLEKQLAAARMSNAAKLTMKAKSEASDARESAMKLGRRLTGVAEMTKRYEK